MKKSAPSFAPRTRIGLLIGAVVAIVYLSFTLRQTEGITPDDFKEMILDASQGDVSLQDEQIKTLDKGNGLYTAKWENLSVLGKVNNDRLTFPYTIMLGEDVYLDEISLGHYQTLALAVIGAADPSLSTSEREHLLQQELQFNDFVYTGTPYQTEKNGLSYDLAGQGNFMMLTIYDPASQENDPS